MLVRTALLPPRNLVMALYSAVKGAPAHFSLRKVNQQSARSLINRQLKGCCCKLSSTHKHMTKLYKSLLTFGNVNIN